MPEQSSEAKKTAIKIATGAVLGGALGITAVLRNLAASKRAVSGSQSAAGGGQAVVDSEQQDEERDGSRAAHISTSRSPDHPDWETLPAAHLPRPTYWPVVLAVGIVFLAWGVVTTVAISVIGLMLLALALGGWIGEWRHGH